MSAANERFTLDTNLLVYAIDSAAGIRHQLSREIVPAGCLAILLKICRMARN
jgi:hypothetical protein